MTDKRKSWPIADRAADMQAAKSEPKNVSMIAKINAKKAAIRMPKC